MSAFGQRLRFRRMDPLTQRFARTTDELGDPYTWLERYEPLNDALPQRRRGDGHHVIDFVGAMRPRASKPAPWWRRVLARLRPLPIWKRP